MTLDKAIEVYEFWANAHERDAEYHRPLGYSHETIANVTEGQAREERQIAEWLKELKAHREAFVKIKEEINSQNGGICDYFIVDRIEEIINEYRPKEGEGE